MFTTLVVVLCHLTGPAAGACFEKVVTNSDMDDSLSMQSCVMGQAALAKWMSESPLYHTGYLIERIKCIPGHYFPKDAA
jgi:hypothetical protein